jgi:hypothetical protein
VLRFACLLGVRRAATAQQYLLRSERRAPASFESRYKRRPSNRAEGRSEVSRRAVSDGIVEVGGRRVCRRWRAIEIVKRGPAFAAAEVRKLGVRLGNDCAGSHKHRPSFYRFLPGIRGTKQATRVGACLELQAPAAALALAGGSPSAFRSTAFSERFLNREQEKPGAFKSFTPFVKQFRHTSVQFSSSPTAAMSRRYDSRVSRGHTAKHDGA